MAKRKSASKATRTKKSTSKATRTKKSARPVVSDVIPLTQTLKYLFNLGYFPNKPWAEVKNTSDSAMRTVLKKYQKFNEIAVTGAVDEQTAHRLSRRRCGLPDFGLTAPSGRACKWPMRKITYFNELSLPGLTKDQVHTAYDIAFNQWAEVCNIEPLRVEKKEVANIYAKSGRGKKNNLDSRGGTLAWSELPCDVSPNIQLDQMFDEAEDWSFSMAIAVMCHELGHALGLGHLNFGALMAPYYDPQVTKPQEEDIREIRRLYGKRKQPYSLTTKPVVLDGEIIINGQAYILVPKT